MAEQARSEVIFPSFRWMDPEGEGVGELEFPCGECGHMIKRESAYNDDAAGIVCERCRTKYILCISVYVKKKEAEE